MENETPVALVGAITAVLVRDSEVLLCVLTRLPEIPTTWPSRRQFFFLVQVCLSNVVILNGFTSKQDTSAVQCSVNCSPSARARVSQRSYYVTQRRPRYSSRLSKFGVKAVVGTHQELDKVERLAEDAQIVFNLVIPYPTSQRKCDTESPCQADADDELLIKAILSGAKTRQALVGESSVLIHTGSTIVRSLLVYTKLILCRPCSPAPTL